MTNRIVRPLSEIAAKPTFRTIDGVAIRFVESDRRDTDALLFSPWPESVFAYEPAWSRLPETIHLVAVDLPGFAGARLRASGAGPIQSAGTKTFGETKQVEASVLNIGYCDCRGRSFVNPSEAASAFGSIGDPIIPTGVTTAH